MRAINAELQARLDAGTTRLCRCWLVRRQDGEAIGFTDHDRDLAFDGVTFRASSGMDASALQSATGLSVDNAQAVGALSDAGVTEEDVRAGRYDRAEIWHWLVDWERTDLRVLLFKGSFGEIRRADGAFEVELRGLAEALNAPVGRSILKTCDRRLGDAKCGFDTGRAGFFGEGTVASGSKGAAIVAGDLGGFSDGWFTQGVLTWLSGSNAGGMGAVKADVRGSAGVRRIALWQAPGRPLAVGDRFRVVAGCDRQAATCKAKFDNLLNFRGFPLIPGDDWVTAYPKEGANHDGSSLLALRTRPAQRWSRGQGRGSGRRTGTSRVAGGRGRTASGCCAACGARRSGRSRKRCRPIPPTGRRRAGPRTCWRLRGGICCRSRRSRRGRAT